MNRRRIHSTLPPTIISLALFTRLSDITPIISECEPFILDVYNVIHEEVLAYRRVIMYTHRNISINQVRVSIRTHLESPRSITSVIDVDHSPQYFRRTVEHMNASDEAFNRWSYRAHRYTFPQNNREDIQNR